MNSCLYVGQVRHRRRTPVEHSFSYTMYMVFLDLDEIDTLFEQFWLWSSTHINVARFKRDDHMQGEDNLKNTVLSYVEKHTGERPTGKVCLLTHLRYFGYVFNPVSFYYCYTSDNQLHSIVAEVNNTPWGEQHIYVLHDKKQLAQHQPILRFHRSKEFHVSPFMPMDIDYTWSLSKPGKRLDVQIENRHKGKKFFDATLALSRKPINHKNMSSVLLRFPLMTLKVLFGIYIEALRLAIKKVPFHDHTEKPILNERSK